MTTINKNATPTTEQLIAALKTLEPSAMRDLSIELLDSHKLDADSTIADLGDALKQHYAAKR